jgi:hypothetical protein
LLLLLLLNSSSRSPLSSSGVSNASRDVVEPAKAVPSLLLLSLVLVVLVRLLLLFT